MTTPPAAWQCLLPGESVQKALKRLRGAGKKPTDQGIGDFNKLMEAANNLLQAGEFGIYSETQLTIRDSVEEAEKAEAVGQWDLKWAPEGEVYGPYSTAQMVQWHKEGYFKQRPVSSRSCMMATCIFHPFAHRSTPLTMHHADVVGPRPTEGPSQGH